MPCITDGVSNQNTIVTTAAATINQASAQNGRRGGLTMHAKPIPANAKPKSIDETGHLDFPPNWSSIARSNDAPSIVVLSSVGTYRVLGIGWARS